MGNIATSPAQYGDTENTLWLKIAQAFYTILSSPSGYVAPQYGDTTNTLILKTTSYFF